jgi:hypothetical protein
VVLINAAALGMRGGAGVIKRNNTFLKMGYFAPGKSLQEII